MLETIVVGPLSVNCYVLSCDRTRKAVVIDPGDDAVTIFSYLQDHDLTCTWILNTHAHADHIGGNAALTKATGAKLGLHPGDRFLLERAVSMAIAFGFSVEASPDPDAELRDRQTISFGKEKLAVLHTPGHSPGGVSFVWSGAVFSGDLLFAGGIGRDDLPGGSFATILESIRKRIVPLGPDTRVYPGHGPATTVADELRSNPFLTDV